MCGRFTLTRPGRDVAELLRLDAAPDLPPRYNVAPTQAVFAVRQAKPHAPREAAMLRWGLVPPWADDVRVGNRLLNARAETVLQKPAFRAAFARRRCLIPADGFYEWQAVGRKRLPILFRFRDGRPFAMAGLWEVWDGPGGAVESCAVLTTSANEVVHPTHDRMPVILPPERFAAWLDPATDPQTLAAWLAPHDGAEMLAVPASPHVNDARHEGPGCWAAEGPRPAPGHTASLFQ